MTEKAKIRFFQNLSTKSLVKAPVMFQASHTTISFVPLYFCTKAKRVVTYVSIFPHATKVLLLVWGVGYSTLSTSLHL